MNVSNPYP